MSQLQKLVAQALKRRVAIPELTDGRTNAYRIFDGLGDGADGLFIDSFAEHWLVQTKGGSFPNELLETGSLGWKSLWWKQLEQQDKANPQFMAGHRQEEILVMENGLKFHIDFQAGYSQGIFLDQRYQRQRISTSLKAGDRLLNLFAYTCAFSVAGAAAGAQTESIDLSRPYLDWGKRNFTANDLATEGHFFCRGDSFDWMRRLANKGNQYQLVVLDPPTFSRNQEGKLWRVEKDYPALVAAALKLTAPGGQVLCCTNHHGVSLPAFRTMLRTGAAQAERSIRDLSLGSQPADFTGESYLKVVWLSV
jgi:23S rRNA (cytosine1962-C5)-methyltransferase